jgi:localization factor PodJL
MKSGGPWNLRGLRPEAREAARAAARRTGVSVGEWLNNVIEPDDDEDDDEPALFTGPDDDGEDDAPRYVRPDDREPRRDRAERPRAKRDSHFDHESAQPREELGEIHARLDRAERPRAERDSDFDRESAQTREDLGEVNARLDRLTQQLERMALANRAPPRQAPRRPPPPPPPPPPQMPAAAIDQSGSRLTGAPVRPRSAAPAALGERPLARNRPAPADAVSIDAAVAEIAARQRALEGNPAPTSAPAPSPAPAPIPAAPISAAAAAPISAPAPIPAPAPALAPQLPIDMPVERIVDLGNLEQQLREITARIEALRPSGDLENSIAALRSDLTEIAHLITEALPRRAVESLEIEVKALAERIDHSRQCGVDSSALAGLERGLTEVREALRGLTPAESLVGFDQAVSALAQKVDMIVAKDDPAALQQLETAIGALRGIVSHVASNETLTKVAEDVRALAAKVDHLAGSAASGEAISALDTRIETLTNALHASTEAGHAVPRELEKLLSGLIEKLEWVQLTHTDHAALAHLEDRIASLVQRFDASDARFGHLEAVERGIADLLVHIEQIRGTNGTGGLQPADVAEIKQIEQRTQDSLEAVQGTVEHVVDRLAMIESGMRESSSRAVPAPQPLVTAEETGPKQPAFASAPAQIPEVVDAPPVTPGEPAPLPAAATAAKRTPIDPDLPPDHPLEPGSAIGRARQAPSAADRIAASEAAVGAAKPAVIADSGAKPDFIAAARRAAQAAAAAPSRRGATSDVASDNSGKPRTRKLIVVGAGALILLGCLQIASRWFEDGAPPPPAPAPSEQAAPPVTALPQPDVASPPPADAAPPQATPTPLPLPSAPPATLPTPPNAKSGAVIDTKPPRQVAAHDGAPQTGTPAPAPALPPAAADITGSVPHAAAPPQSLLPAAASAPLGDKLPATIGGPSLRAAALSGDAAADYEVAMRFADGRGVAPNNEEAALWLQRAAKQGLAPAQFRLGALYEKGVGVKKDLATARDLYLAAAKKGNGKAMHNLAVLYAEGIDGPADYTDAAQWFHTAADHGITDSQFNLGILYARGIGVAQNYAESYKWFALAAAQGDKDAGKKADEVAAHLDTQSLAAAQLAVKTWTPEPQPDDAITVKAPPGGWDGTASATPAKSKPRTAGTKTPTVDAKVN